MFGKLNGFQIYLSFYVSLLFSKWFEEFWIIQTNLFNKNLFSLHSWSFDQVSFSYTLQILWRILSRWRNFIQLLC